MAVVSASLFRTMKLYGPVIDLLTVGVETPNRQGIRILEYALPSRGYAGSADFNEGLEAERVSPGDTILDVGLSVSYKLMDLAGQLVLAQLEPQSKRRVWKHGRRWRNSE